IRRVRGRPHDFATFAMSRNARFMVAAIGSQQAPRIVGDLVWIDLLTGNTRTITTHGREFFALAVDDTGRVVASADMQGAIRVGKSTGEKPHLLLGHPEWVQSLAISPDRRSIASASGGEVRVWPIPDLNQAPLHTLPQQELLQRARQMTNLVAVPDARAENGYRMAYGPFPGWK
ncbi:MAG TPA: hypothetical protein VF057_10245, partial [Thermoanaerobaculia bacterium]